MASGPLVFPKSVLQPRRVKFNSFSVDLFFFSIDFYVKH